MISIAHSPDSDDYFMFWALATGRVRDVDLEFSFTALATEELNRRACSGEFHVTAASVGALAQAAEHYAVLSHGASVGRGYGPRVITREPADIAELSDTLIGIPGNLTTAALVLRQALPNAAFVEIPIVPYSRIFEELDSARIDAALLIHEGQFAFDQQKYFQVMDIGIWWQEQHRLPLPLGVNLIAKSLWPESTHKISSAIKKSIACGIEHIDEAIPYLQKISEDTKGPCLSDEELRDYLYRYANQDSLQLDAPCKQAIALLVDTAAAGAAQQIEYID